MNIKVKRADGWLNPWADWRASKARIRRAGCGGSDRAGASPSNAEKQKHGELESPRKKEPGEGGAMSQAEGAGVMNDRRRL